jgi:hypothetical protein
LKDIESANNSKSVENIERTGLKKIASNKNEIEIKDIVLEELEIVIGPKYILKELVETPSELESYPEHEYFFEHFVLPREDNNDQTSDAIVDEFQQGIDFQNKKARAYLELGLINNSARKYCFFPITNRPAKPIDCTRRLKLRRKRGGKNNYRRLERIDSKKKRIKLEERIVNYKSKRFTGGIFRVSSKKHPSFRNTTDKLDTVPVRNRPSIIFELSKSTHKIRNFRVDGIRTENSRLLRLLHLIDNKIIPGFLGKK